MGASKAAREGEKPRNLRQYIKVDIVYKLIVHNDAGADLKEIAQHDKETAAKLGRFIRQLQADQDLLDRLSRIDFGGRPNRPQPRNAKFNIKMWGALQDVGYNLWRLRAYFDEALPYRFVYAFFPPAVYVLLAIVEKADDDNSEDERFNYEPNHPISDRIKRAFRSLEDQY